MIDDTTTTTDQGDDQSVVDRIANKFGFPGSQQADDGASAATDDGTATGEAEFAEIEWSGEKYQIPAKLKDAFMQNADYTQKTQAIAERGKQMDHMREVAEQGMASQQFMQSVAAEQQEIAVIDAYLNQTKGINWANMNTEQMFRQRVELDNVRQRRQELQDSLSAKRGKFDAEMKERLGQLRAKAREMAAKSITGFSEETEKAVRQYAASEGLGEREIDGILVDPRSFGILWKASQFDKIKASAGKGRVADATTRTLKPGAGSERMPAKTAAQLNFNRAMKGAKNSSQKADVIATKLASNSIFNRGGR